jgi:aryl-alcohol dehydrogenase-like predicted oxidoreductase
MSDDSRLPRRDLLKLGAAAAAGFVTGEIGARAGAAPLRAMPNNRVTAAAMPTRNLGRTGFRVGLFSLGGQAAIEKADNADVAVPLIERALNLGVNYIDTSARYGGAERWSEQYIGQVMKKRRGEAFLATKTHDRSRDGSLKLLEKSLALLQTDHIDLWQIHNLDKMSQIDEIFAKGGAVEALVKAREEKLVRFIGVTGHADPDVLLEAIRRFPFDAILMAVNAADPHHMSFSAKLLPMAVEQELAIIGMKIPSRGRLLGPLTMQEAMRYTLSLPVSTVIVGCDSIAQLEQNVEIARSFTPLSESQMATLSTKAEPVKREALFYRPWKA